MQNLIYCCNYLERTAVEEQRLVITILDNGIDMKESTIATIYEPFFTTKEVGKGTGQGLAIAYSTLVDKHQGTIKCESSVGNGTTFFISLPLKNS